jgi:hypothetical protein
MLLQLVAAATETATAGSTDAAVCRLETMPSADPSDRKASRGTASNPRARKLLRIRKAEV